MIDSDMFLRRHRSPNMTAGFANGQSMRTVATNKVFVAVGGHPFGSLLSHAAHALRVLVRGPCPAQSAPPQSSLCPPGALSAAGKSRFDRATLDLSDGWSWMEESHRENGGWGAPGMQQNPAGLLQAGDVASADQSPFC
jgi:hypothetical protein